jgi:hypothetical protein
MQYRPGFSRGWQSASAPWTGTDPYGHGGRRHASAYPGINIRRRAGLRTVLCWLALNAWAACALAAEPVRLVDLMPSFWRFWQQTPHTSLAHQRAALTRAYLQPNQAVWRDLQGPCAKHLQDAALDQDYLPLLPQLVGPMRTLQRTLPTTIARTRAHFARTFPDMNWHGDIYLMASLGCFNGRSQLIDGRQALLLGLDDIAYLHENNLPPLLEHELFHRYQHAYFDFEPERDEPLWVRLWAEGLATYVSQQLSPQASAMDTMWMTDAKLRALDRQCGPLATVFVSKFDSTDRIDAANYFLLDNSNDPAVPGHTGYYLDMRVAQWLHQSHTLQSLAHWSRAQAEEPIRTALAHACPAAPPSG